MCLTCFSCTRGKTYYFCTLPRCRRNSEIEFSFDGSLFLVVSRGTCAAFVKRPSSFLLTVPPFGLLGRNRSYKFRIIVLENWSRPTRRRPVRSRPLFSGLAPKFVKSTEIKDRESFFVIRERPASLGFNLSSERFPAVGKNSGHYH